MRMTIKLKLTIAFALLIALLLGTALYGVTSLGTLKDAMTAMTTGPVTRLELAQRINIGLLQGIRQQKNLLASITPAEAQAARTRGDNARAELNEAINKALSLATAAGKPRWLKIQDFSKQFEVADNRIRELMQAGDTAGAGKLSITDARQAANDKIGRAHV